MAATLAPFPGLITVQAEKRCLAPFKATRTRYCSSVISSRQVICLAKKTASYGNANPTTLEGKVQDPEEEVILEGLNELTLDALNLMLGKQSKSLLDCLEEIDEAGEYLVKEGKIEAARFVLVIKEMLEHRMAPQKDDLEGPYKKAFDKIWGLVEDSGWRITTPENPNGVDPLDDELIPPVLGQL